MIFYKKETEKNWVSGQTCLFPRIKKRKIFIQLRSLMWKITPFQISSGRGDPQHPQATLGTTLCQYDPLPRGRSPRSPSSSRNRAPKPPTPIASAKPSRRGTFPRPGLRRLQLLPEGWQSSAPQTLWTTWASRIWAKNWGCQSESFPPWGWMFSRWAKMIIIKYFFFNLFWRIRSANSRNTDFKEHFES